MGANDLRKKAQQCRELARDAVKEEVAYQLRQWAEDYEAEADVILRNERSGSDTEHTAGDATCPASGSATAHDGPAAANTDSQS